MTSISTNVYINKLGYLVNENNNINHSTFKMMPVDVNSSTYIDFGAENNDKDPKFKVGDHVRISKYKNVFEKRYAANWGKEIFVIKKVRNTVPWTYVKEDPKSEEIIGTFFFLNAKNKLNKV